MELRATIQELQNEVNCVNDLRDFFKDAESALSGPSNVHSEPVFFPPPSRSWSRSWRNAEPFSGNAEPQQWAARDTHGISGNVFANPTASSSAPYPGGCNPWISDVTEDNTCTDKYGTRCVW